jgi:hypothetical protein
MSFYIKKAQQELVSWTEDMPLDLISISEADKLNGSPKQGDMIAINPKDKTDMWLVAEQFFKDNYIPAIEVTKPDNSKVTADLIKERDELKAHCDFLTYAFNRCYSCVPDDGSSVSNECFEEFSDKLLQTPKQSLNEIKAQA